MGWSDIQQDYTSFFFLCSSNEHVLYLQCLKITDLTDIYYIPAVARNHPSTHLYPILAL